MTVLQLIDKLKEMRRQYLIHKVTKVQIPEFKDGNIVRKKLTFSGKVQNVGFRLETHEIGKRIGLKGWVKNKEDGTVETEVEGEEEKINYLINHLKSIRRASVKGVLIEEQEVVGEDEGEFKIIC